MSYKLPGSEAIAEETIKTIRNHNIVIWEKHGIFAIGNSLDKTYDNIEIACKAAKIYFLCVNAGFQPEGLTDNDINELANHFDVE